MSITHHYIITYNTETEEWAFDNESESCRFPRGTIFDDEKGEWHYEYLGDGEYYPDADALGEKLSKALEQLNESSTK